MYFEENIYKQKFYMGVISFTVLNFQINAFYLLSFGLK